jgi:phosphonopyruvate decarboxylase
MSDSSSGMPLAEVLQILHEARQDEVVVATMGSGREWSKFPPHPLDLVYVPSSMGQATSVGLGIALAQPDRKVVVCNGDGSMLMNLGSLVTITSRQPENLIVLLMDNGIYEVTGRQSTPGSATLRADGRSVDFVAIARSCGFEAIFEFAELDDWRESVADVLQTRGPVFCCLKVESVEGEVAPRSPGPAWERAARLRAALSGG